MNWHLFGRHLTFMRINAMWKLTLLLNSHGTILSVSLILAGIIMIIQGQLYNFKIGHTEFLHIFDPNLDVSSAIPHSISKDTTITLDNCFYRLIILRKSLLFNSIRQIIILSSTGLPFKFFYKMMSKRDFLKIINL